LCGAVRWPPRARTARWMLASGPRAASCADWALVWGRAMAAPPRARGVRLVGAYDRPAVGERSAAVVIAAVAPAVVLGVDPWGWFPFGPVKWLAVSVLVPAGAAVVFARRPVRWAVVPTALALAFVGWLALAAAFGEDGLYAWVGTPERHLGVLTWALAAVALVVGQSLRDERDARIVGGGLVVAGLGLGLVSTAEALGWEPDVLDVGGRLSATLGSPAYLGAAAALLLPALIGIAADRTWGRVARAAAGAGAAGLSVAVVGSGARAAWFGLAVAGIAALWGQRDRVAALGRTVRPGLASGVVVAVVAVATVLVAVGPVGARVAGTFDRDEPGGRGRLDEWRVAARVLADDPVVGVGPEGYRVAFASGVDAAYERAHGRDPQPDRAHSTPLDLALAGGVPAVALWIGLVVLAGRYVLRAMRGDEPWLAGIAAGLVAHVAGGLFLFPVAELEPVVWLLAGLVLARGGTAAARTTERAAPRAAVVVGLAVAAVVALAAGIVDVAADRHAGAAADALAVGDGATAADEAAAAVRLRPDVVRLHLLDSRARVADQQGFAAALDAVDDALAVSPGDPIALRERARLLVARAEATRAPDHIDAARAELERRLADDPVDATLWSLAAVAAELDGDFAAADAALARAEDLRPEDSRADDRSSRQLWRGNTDHSREFEAIAVARDPYCLATVGSGSIASGRRSGSVSCRMSPGSRDGT
jgi:tetratricopeptide (TPR) repeat protein